jgi:hypothetical protein
MGRVRLWHLVQDKFAQAVPAPVEQPTVRVGRRLLRAAEAGVPISVVPARVPVLTVHLADVVLDFRLAAVPHAIRDRVVPQILVPAMRADRVEILGYVQIHSNDA